MRDDQKNPVLRYGSRKSGKLLRCYWKQDLASYRVELELHSGLLRKLGIRRSQDLTHIGRVIYPDHVQFVHLDWEKLKSYLTRKLGTRGHEVLREARIRATSIGRAARYLRRKGVLNLHRFYSPLPINKSVELALRTWSIAFARSEAKCAAKN